MQKPVILGGGTEGDVGYAESDFPALGEDYIDALRGLLEAGMSEKAAAGMVDLVCALIPVLRVGKMSHDAIRARSLHILRTMQHDIDLERLHGR